MTDDMDELRDALSRHTKIRLGLSGTILVVVVTLLVVYFEDQSTFREAISANHSESKEANLILQRDVLELRRDLQRLEASARAHLAQWAELLAARNQGTIDVPIPSHMGNPK